MKDCHRRQQTRWCLRLRRVLRAQAAVGLQMLEVDACVAG